MRLPRTFFWSSYGVVPALQWNTFTTLKRTHLTPKTFIPQDKDLISVNGTLLNLTGMHTAFNGECIVH